MYLRPRVLAAVTPFAEPDIPQALEELATAKIPASFSSRLNNLKTQNPEAFFYWLKTFELMK